VDAAPSVRVGIYCFADPLGLDAAPVAGQIIVEASTEHSPNPATTSISFVDRITLPSAAPEWTSQDHPDRHVDLRRAAYVQLMLVSRRRARQLTPADRRRAGRCITVQPFVYLRSI